MQLASLLNCDLAILAYQLYHQATVWPLDPWYEIIAHPGSDRRTTSMRTVHQNLPAVTGIVGGSHYSGPAAIRGHGVSNANLDPILTRFEAMDPWSPVWNGDGTNFVGVQTPSYVTDPLPASVQLWWSAIPPRAKSN